MARVPKEASSISILCPGFFEEDVRKGMDIECR